MYAKEQYNQKVRWLFSLLFFVMTSLCTLTYQNNTEKNSLSLRKVTTTDVYSAQRSTYKKIDRMMPQDLELQKGKIPKIEVREGYTILLDRIESIKVCRGYWTEYLIIVGLIIGCSIEQVIWYIHNKDGSKPKNSSI